MSLLVKVAFNCRHLSRQKHPVRSMFAYALSKARLSWLIHYKRNGLTYQLRSSGLSRLLWSEPGLLLDGEQFLSTVSRTGDTVVDVGANIGVLSLLVSRILGPSGFVLAIEAHPRTYLALVKSLKMNHVSNVKPLNIAVGSEAGILRFSDRLDDDWNRVDANFGTLEVEVKPLDALCEDMLHIDILKIDVEGFELNVLQGAIRVLSRTDCVLLECWSAHTEAFGYTPDDLIQFMRREFSYGYRLDEDDATISLTSLAHVQRTETLENWVFVRDPSWIAQRSLKINISQP